MPNPAPEQVLEGHRMFRRHERRDAMYRTATFLVSHFWGKPTEMADSLGVLLLTWNQAFYRYGSFDFDKLDACISLNFATLAEYRNRNVLSYTQSDDGKISHLFNQFLAALEIEGGSKAGAKSPVSVSKALHLLGPSFFPLWDDKIARAYGYSYYNNPASTYISFLRDMKDVARELQTGVNTEETGSTLLKLIDEYNYAKYTKGWI